MTASEHRVAHGESREPGAADHPEVGDVAGAARDGRARGHANGGDDRQEAERSDRADTQPPLRQPERSGFGENSRADVALEPRGRRRVPEAERGEGDDAVGRRSRHPVVHRLLVGVEIGRRRLGDVDGRLPRVVAELAELEVAARREIEQRRFGRVLVEAPVVHEEVDDGG